MKRRNAFVYCGLMTFALAASEAEVAAQSADSSAAAARTLVALLDARQLDAVAVADPGEHGRYVAALYFPGSQLLVVSAKHPSVASLDYRLAHAQYRDAYLDLQATPMTADKFFVQDTGANGLVTDADRSGLDIVYVNGVERVPASSLDRRTDRAVRQAELRQYEARYLHALELLAAAVHDSGARAAAAAIP